MTRAPTCVALAPDGQALLWGAVGGMHGAPGIDGQANHFLVMLSAPTVIAFSVDGKLAAIGSKAGDLLLWDVGKRELIHQWKIPEPGRANPERGLRIETIVFSADGKRLLCGAGGAIRVWDVTSKMHVKDVPVGVGGDGTVKALSLSPDGGTVAVGSEGLDGKILALDVRKLEVRTSWVARDKEDINCLQHSADGKYLFAGLDSGIIQVFDANTGAERAWFQTRSTAVRGIALSPKGYEVAWVGTDCTVHRWDLRTMREIQAGNGHTSSVEQVIFSDTGEALVSCSADRTVRVWSVIEPSKEPIVLEHPRGVLAIGLTAGSKALISGAEDGKIRTWDWKKGRVSQELTPTDPPFYGSIALSPDGHTLVFGTRTGVVGVYDLQTGKSIKSIKAHSSAWDCGVEFSRDGKMLVSVGYEGVKVWETTGWTQIAARESKRKTVMPLKPHFAPDSKSLAYALDGRTISIIRVGAGWEELHGMRLQGALPSCFAYSPSGRIFAAGTTEGTVRLWKSATTERLGEIRLGRAGLKSLAFSPDGRKVGAGLSDSTVVVADVTEFTERAEKKR